MKNSDFGVWYGDEDRRNISLKLVSNGTRIALNSQAELGAILEVPRRNKTDNLVIESDSLTSLRAICNQSDKYKDIGWSGTQNEDLLKSILIRLRTRPAQTTFRWVKGHADNYRNNRADALANNGRENDFQVEIDEEEWLNEHPALQDGARLQALEINHMSAAQKYNASISVLRAPKELRLVMPAFHHPYVKNRNL